MSSDQLELQFHKRPKRVRGAKPLKKGARMRIIEKSSRRSSTCCRACVPPACELGDALDALMWGRR